MGSDVRRARAALVATALTILTLAGHTAGQGSLSLTSVLLVTLLSTGLAMAATRRPLTWSRAWLVLLAGQALLHIVMTFTAGHGHGSTGINAALMITGHVAAGAIAAGVLMHADGLLTRWSAFIAAALGTVPLMLAEPTTAPCTVLATPEGARESHDVLRHGVVRRGPPSPAVALLH
jgi:hypothetical protein